MLAPVDYKALLKKQGMQQQMQATAGMPRLSEVVSNSQLRLRLETDTATPLHSSICKRKRYQHKAIAGSDN
jgi:hypothetical protein